MMLLYKAWRETEARFLVGVLAVTGCCVIMALQSGTEGSLTTSVFGGSLFFELLVIFLGLGGLLRERTQHTAVFTLALPVSRIELLAAQAGAGMAEMTFLAVLPALLLPALSAATRQPFNASEALRFCLLRVICGAFIFAVSFLLSVLLRGEYTAPVACFVVLFLEARAVQWAPSLRPWLLIPQATMGAHWAYAGTRNIDQPLPWPGLSIMLLTAAILFAASIRITQKETL